MGYLGLLMVVGIISLMAFVSYKSYFKQVSPQMSQQVQKGAAEVGVNAATSGSTLDDISSRLKAASQTEIDRTKDLEGTR
jgi:hypothetical protein